MSKKPVLLLSAVIAGLLVAAFGLMVLRKIENYARQHFVENHEAEGWLAEKKGEWPRALKEFNTAATKTNHARDPLERSRIQYGIAYVLEDLGNLAEAEPILRQVIADRQQLLGPEHPETLRGRNSLAGVFFSQHKYVEAEQEQQAVLSLRERVLGPEHPDTLTTRNNLALTLNDQGRHTEAVREYRTLQAIYERVLGAEHFDTLRSRNNLALALYGQENFADAEREYRLVLAGCERNLGAKHPIFLRACHNLALVLKEQGKLPEALSFARRAWDGYREIFGAEHPNSKEDQDICERIEAELAGQRSGKPE